LSVEISDHWGFCLSGTVMQPVEPRVTEWTFWPPESESAKGLRGFHITVQYRGHGRWAIYKDNLCLNRVANEFEQEHSPSNREDNHAEIYRWEDVEAAKARAKEIAELYQQAWEDFLAARERTPKDQWTGNERYFFPQVQP
jgi:hypothetical protein